MFSLDARIRGLPASREQVVALYQSINQPHLAIPGKQAGPAQAFIVGLKGNSGFNAVVYLFLSEAEDCAVYTSSVRNVPSEQYEPLEGDALGFVESMGFMMDNLNFRALGEGEQEEMMKALPVFGRDPKLTSASFKKSPSSVQKSAAVLLGRIFSSF